MKKIKKLNNNNQGIKRYLSPQPSNIRNKKQRKTIDLIDGDTEHNDAGVFAHKRNSNDDDIQNKDSSSKDCLQLKATTAPNKSIENINWNSFVQDPGELYELRYPVSFSTFKTMTHCLNVIKRILEDIKVATGIDFTNDELIKERVLKNFYKQFYDQPQIRNVYQLEIKACPTFVKKKIMQITTLSDETNRDTNANEAAKMTADKCSKGAAMQTIKHSKPAETNDNSLPVNSNSDDLCAAGKPVELNSLKEQTPQHIDILDDTRQSVEPELIKRQNLQPLNVADKSIELMCVEAQSSQCVNHCEATNDQRQLENVEAQSSQKEEIVLPQQRVTPTVCRPTKKIYISKSVAFADLDFLKTHIKRRVPDGGKQQIILERIALELLQQNKYAELGHVIKKEFAVKEKSADVDENVIDITDKSSQVTLVDLSQIDRVQQAKALFFQGFPKTNTLPYALRFHKGLKRYIIAAILEMSMEEFKKYTKIHDAAEIYDDAELLKTLYHCTIKSNKIWPQNLYMPLNDLREYLKTKGVHIADDNLEDISPMLLHWQELSEITNFDEIVRWDYYRCKGEIFGKDMDSFGIYRKTFYEKCWLYNNWLREVPKLINTVDNNSMEKDEIPPMEVDEDAEGAENANKCENNENVESEQRMNAAPEVVAVDEIEEAITHEAHTNEMEVDHAEESTNTPLAVKNAEHSNEASLAQNEVAIVVANQAAEPIAGTSTVHSETQDDQLTAESSSHSTLNAEITTEIQHTELRDAAAKQTSTVVALDETPRNINQDCEISSREIIAQQRLQRAKELYFKEVEKPCTLAYLVRFHNGIKRHILQAILCMSFEEFKEYTHIYDAAEIYNDSELLQRCYEYALKKPQVWPINLYIHLPNLFKYLQTKDITLSEADLKHISPKLLHWHELTTLTNYDYIVAWDYYRCSGKKMPKNIALREPYRQKFYTKCWFYDKWLWYTPKLSTIMLSEDLMERSEMVIKEENNENTVFEQSVVVHAMTDSERDVVESPKGTERHDRENSAGHEHAASSIALPINNARPVCMVDAEIQTSQRLLATITDLQTVVPNTAERPIPEPFPLPGKAIKEEKLEPLNKLQFNLTKDEENYECVPLPDDVVDLDTSRASTQSMEQILLPLSNSETLATQDFTSLLACESGEGRNEDKRSENQNYELNTQCNCLTQEAHEEDVESETLAQNACENEGETEEISSPPLGQAEIEAQPQTNPRRDSIVEGQQQQIELSTISPLQKPISRQVKQEIIEQQHKQAEVTKKRLQNALQKNQLDTAMTRIFEANLLLQKRKQKEKQQQQQRAKKLKCAAVALKKHQQSLKNNQQQQSIENKQQQEKSIENKQQQQSMENKQEQEKSIEDKQQPEKSIENKQQQQSMENKQEQDRSIESDQKQQSINDQQQKSIKNDQQQQKSVENDQQQQKSIEKNQEERSIKNKQQKPIENRQQQQSMENKQKQPAKTRHQQKSVENEQQQQQLQISTWQKQQKERQQPKQSLTLLQQHQQQMENSVLQEQQKEKGLNQLADEEISKEQQPNEEKNPQTSFERPEKFSTQQQQRSSVELQSIQRKQMLVQKPSLQHIQQQQQQKRQQHLQKQQQQQQQQTIRKSLKTHQKSEPREQQKTGEKQKIQKPQQLLVEQVGTKLNQLQQPRTQLCVQQEEKTQSHQRKQTQQTQQEQQEQQQQTQQEQQQQTQQEQQQQTHQEQQQQTQQEQQKTQQKQQTQRKQQQQTQQKQHQQTEQKQHQQTEQKQQQAEQKQHQQAEQKQHQQTQQKQQKHTQQADNEDLTKWLLKVTTQYQQLQHQQQESVVQQQQQTAEQQQQIVTIQESRSQKQQQPQQKQPLQKQSQQQQQQHKTPIPSQQQRHEEQQWHEQGQQQQNFFTNEHTTLQQYSHPEILLQRTSTQIKEQLVLRSSAGTLTATNLPPLNQQANRPTTTTSTATKTKTVKQAKSTTTTTTLRKAAKISDYVPQLTHAFQPLPIGLNTKKALSQLAASTTTATSTAIDEQQNQFGSQQIVPANNLALTPTATTMAAATATATPPMLLALPVSVGNVNNVSGGNNSFVFSLSGDNTLFNSSELFRILEGIQLQRCQHEQQLQQQQQQQHLQVQMLQLPQQIQIFDRNSSQPLVFVHPDMLQQQQQQQLQLPQQLQQLQIPQLQQQQSPLQPLQQSQLQLLQQQAQLQQLQQQQGQLQQQPQLLQQQFAQLQLPEQQLMPYNQTLMMERQQQQQQLQQHYEPPIQISQPLALLNVDAEHQQQPQNQSYQLLSSAQQQQHVCQLMDALQTLRCAGSEENENPKGQQQSPEYGVQEDGNTNSLQQHTHLHTEHKHPLTNTTNDMLQVNICVEHTYTNTPIHSPNLVTPSLSSPKGPTRMCTPAGLKRFFCRRLEKLDYFSEVTALNIAEYQLQCSSIGQSYLQVKLRTTQLRTMVHGDIMAALLPRCTPKLIEDLQLVFQYVGEFHFDMWQQQRQRKFISKCTHRTLHTLCAHVLLLFFAYSTPFQTKCLNSAEETRCFEPSNVLSTCVAGVSVNKVEQSFGELSMAVDPGILAQMAVLKRNL